MVENGDPFFHHSSREDAAKVDWMVRAGGAVPRDRSGEFASAGVEEKNRAAFGRDYVEEHGEQLPLERVEVAHGPDRGADFEQSGERAGQADCRRKRREGFGLQVEQVVWLELLRGEAESDVIVKLDGTAFGGCRRFRKKQKGRITDGNLIAEGEHALGNWNTVDVSAGGRVQIAQQEAAGAFGNRTMLGCHGRVFQPDSVGRIAPNGESSGDGKAGVFPAAADDGDSWSQVLGPV